MTKPTIEVEGETDLRLAYTAGWPKRCECCDKWTYKRYESLLKWGRTTVACCPTHAVRAQRGKRQKEKRPMDWLENAKVYWELARKSNTAPYVQLAQASAAIAIAVELRKIAPPADLELRGTYSVGEVVAQEQEANDGLVETRKSGG